MTIVCTLKTSSYNPADQTSYTTASISPTANVWLVVDCAGRRNPVLSPYTVTGLGGGTALTWTLESSQNSTEASPGRIERWYAFTGASPGTGTITISHGAETSLGTGWIVYEISGADTSDPFVQSAGHAPGPGTGISITLSAFASTDNRPLIAVYHEVNEASSPDTTPSLYTELGDVNGTGGNLGLASAYNPNDTDTAVGYSWTTAAGSAGIASEIKALGAAGGAVLDPMGMRGFFGA